MPPFDETARVGPSAGSVRRPSAARSATGGADAPRRPASPSRARAASSRGDARPPAARSGGGGGRPPVKPPTGGRRPGGSSSGGPGRPPAGGKRKRTGKQRRRRWLKVLAGAFLGMLVLLGVFVGVVYASTDVPSPDSITNKQASVVYYSDGVTEMARLTSPGGNRTNVKLSEISEPARNAVLAAENRSFYDDPGISFTGIARAAWNNVTGGSTQGGSTITQQYVKNAILNSDQTYSRKFKELFLAVKLDNEYTKDEILENYLNTIYFGRGAYGIETAATTYFGVPASQLTAEQGAVLAVLIRNPSANDPETNPEGAQKRWGLVLDAMVEAGWVDPAARTPMVYPAVLPKTTAQVGIPTGPEGLVVRQVLDEVQADGYADVESAGLRITSTVDKDKQAAAVASVQDVMAGEDPALRQALVAIDPKTGGVLAYYGNAQTSDDPATDTTDYAEALKPPGSSFKPYTLATALAQGISVDARRDGSSPQEFKDRPGKPVRNSGNVQCPACTLKEAITKSLNTTFYGLAVEVGADNVAKTAREAMGMDDTFGAEDSSVPPGLRGKATLTATEGEVTGGAIGIGEYPVRPIDQAVGFATLAAGGMYHPRHFVAQVTDSEGTVLEVKDGSNGASPVIDPSVASDVTFALEDVAKSSKRPLEGDRPVAAKTGTQGLNDQDNSDAWMVGYTPSISTAVWMGTQGSAAITNVQGKIIYGSGLPGAIWQEFMNTVLAGTPEEPLPTKAVIKGDKGTKAVADPTTEAPVTALPPAAVVPVPETAQAPVPSATAAAPQSTGAAESRARDRARAEADRARQIAEEARKADEARRQAAEASRAAATQTPTQTQPSPPAQPSAPVQPIPSGPTN
ncbi:penicillin-binding protein [Modestobacter sp. L9-4]|uniref:transglycosylase domain-containing protein n=1 Tax=Modestobacter sp. L9-4 TaxID=2851567 RepID=UPI001C779D29|nr:transglycosylase domain-containing protein [Modestobacter sp. L9-4]QXG74316.1 penicillin-binding protein [Modestobacter sp. L9-4]